MAGGHSARLTAYVFDTGPLSVFAKVGRLDILEQRYAGRALWTSEVEVEVRRGQGLHPELTGIVTARWLDDPVVINDPEELRMMERFRWALGGSARLPDRHRGEAATLVVASVRGAVAVLDDLDVRRLADSERISFIGTLGILKACVRDGVLSADDAWHLAEAMRTAGARFPSWLDRDYFGV